MQEKGLMELDDSCQEVWRVSATKVRSRPQTHQPPKTPHARANSSGTVAPTPGDVHALCRTAPAVLHRRSDARRHGRVNISVDISRIVWAPILRNEVPSPHSRKYCVVCLVYVFSFILIYVFLCLLLNTLPRKCVVVPYIFKGRRRARVLSRSSRARPVLLPLRSLPLGAGQQPFVWDISNVVEAGKPVGALGASELQWHSDMSYVARPPTYSILYAAEVPVGGRPCTCFLSMTRALERLPARLRHQIQGRQLCHDGSCSSDGLLRSGFAEVRDVANNPHAVAHPAVRRLPDTGESALFLGRRRNSYVLGLPVPESEALLDAMWEAVLPHDGREVYEHCWRAGEILVWDNRRLMHRRDAFDSTRRRVMWRTQVQGEAVLSA